MLNFKTHRYIFILILRMGFYKYSHFNGLTELVKKKDEYID